MDAQQKNEIKANIKRRLLDEMDFIEGPQLEKMQYYNLAMQAIQELVIDEANRVIVELQKLDEKYG